MKGRQLTLITCSAAPRRGRRAGVWAGLGLLLWLALSLPGRAAPEPPGVAPAVAPPPAAATPRVAAPDTTPTGVARRWLGHHLPHWNDDFVDGVACGLGGALAILLLITYLYWRRRRRKRRTVMQVSAEHGELYLTHRAVRDLIVRSLDDFRELTVKAVDIRHLPGRYQILVDVEISPGLSLHEEKLQMQERIIRQFREQIGIPEEVGVDFTVLSYAADRREPK